MNSTNTRIISNGGKKMSKSEQWVSLEDIADHLSISKDTVRGWIKKGTIPYHKVGRQYRFRISEVDSWIESGASANIDKKNKLEDINHE
jgi:excisionase family DNA binding protein